MQVSEYLESPKSRSPLKYVDGKVVSTADESESYPVQNSVVIFDASDVEDKEVQNSLNRLFEAARDTDCLEAITAHSNSKDYLINEDRRKYIDLIQFKPSDVVLEIGASMGQHSRFIAQRCHHLEALEVVPEQAAFAKLWCEQSGQSNVNVSAGGANGILPYKTDSFDVLIINYVLEWSASRSSVHPQTYHRQLLAECLRVIKPGGKMFLSTKNRYNIALLAGGVDEHMGFRFGSALPRWLANSIGAFVESEHPRGHLHSRNAIEELFTSVGFTDLKPFLCLPDARQPQVIESLDQAGIKKIGQSNYWETASRKERLFSRLPYALQKNISPSHVYMATKPQVS